MEGCAASNNAYCPAQAAKNGSTLPGLSGRIGSTHGRFGRWVRMPDCRGSVFDSERLSIQQIICLLFEHVPCCKIYAPKVIRGGKRGKGQCQTVTVNRSVKWRLRETWRREREREIWMKVRTLHSIITHAVISTQQHPHIIAKCQCAQNTLWNDAEVGTLPTSTRTPYRPYHSP